MHVVFFAYGDLERVNFFIQEIIHQKFPWRFYKKKYKEGEKELFQQMSTRVNQLPGGAYDIVIPREYKDMVLTTLNFDIDYYEVGFVKKAFLRKVYKCKKAKFKKTEREFLWIKNGVNFLPIGIREDGEQPEINSEWENFHGKGWFHEAM